MQVTNPGRKLWDAIFRDKADKIYAELPANSLLKPPPPREPPVARVVFFSVPHRGSDLANLRISHTWLKRSLLPSSRCLSRVVVDRQHRWRTFSHCSRSLQA
jgi:hypothetical protein